MADPVRSFPVRTLKAIAAMSVNRVIGSGNRIPWHLPEDFRWFKRMTSGKTVVMGRRTFESLGRPLPNRINVVLTRDAKLLDGTSDGPVAYQGAKVGPSALDVLRRSSGSRDTSPSAVPTELLLLGDLQELVGADRVGDTWVIGGASIYEQALPYCAELFLTHVKRVVDGDTYFPAFEDQFTAVADVLENDDFKVTHYVHRERLLA